MSLRVLIAVTHLLGAGHLTRAAALARGFARAGHATTLVSGGAPARLSDLDGARVVQLPPVRTASTDFRTLLDENLAPVDDAYLARRRDLLLDTLRSTRPDILITELFPFGRRVLAAEFDALLEAARDLSPRPLVLCSIRDILVASSKPERIEETHARLLRDYDAVLVHGDPRFLPLEASWPVNDRIAPLIRYTGYVDESEEAVPAIELRGIVVSGGSSAASLPLYRAAIEASRTVTDRPWHVLVGRGVAEAEFAALQATAPAHVTVERARPDFRHLLTGAELSVSQAGYNTAVDLLRCGARAILVPFEAGQETEQRLRAERLKALGCAEIVPEDELSPERLAEAIRQRLGQPPPPSLSIPTDGVRQSVALAAGLVRPGPALHRSIDWRPLDEALERAGDRGFSPGFWWRDDDAAAETPQLDRLLRLARRYEAGIGLAAIPATIRPSLGTRLAEEEGAFALVHGWSHANHAPEGEKKAEFGSHRDLEIMAAEAERSLQAARASLGARLLPVFVPPWNRIAKELVPVLPRLGFAGLSTFTDRTRARPAEGLVQVNTHVDPIDWHGTRSLAEPERIVASLARAVERRIAGAADRDEPIGFLTHHLVQDEVIWWLCEKLIAHLAARSIRFLPPDACFGMETRLQLRSNGI